MVSRLRLASGLVLFAYVATHLANHALGLVSLQVLETARGWFVAMWRSPPATAALYGALGLHLGLALWAVYRRRRLLAVDWRALQLLLGLLVPPFLVLHVLGTRFAHQFLGVNDSYTYILLIYFKFSPLDGVKQAIVLVAAWFHGCMGLHYQLRAASWYARARAGSPGGGGAGADPVAPRCGRGGPRGIAPGGGRGMAEDGAGRHPLRRPGGRGAHLSARSRNPARPRRVAGPRPIGPAGARLARISQTP